MLGESDKTKRYPPTRGRAVTPAVMEAWGRLGPTFEGLIDELAAAAATRQRERGEPAVSWGSRWRFQLSTLAASAVARAVRLSSLRDALGSLQPWGR